MKYNDEIYHQMHYRFETKLLILVWFATEWVFLCIAAILNLNSSTDSLKMIVRNNIFWETELEWYILNNYTGGLNI